MDPITIDCVCDYVGQSVTIKGWLYNKRSSGKLIFLEIRDGTGVLQGIASQGDSPSAFSKAESLSREASMIVRGLLREDKRAPGGCELQIEEIDIVQVPPQDFPIELKRHSPDFLMDHRHLWIRTGRQVPILRIRDAVFRAIRGFFHERGFVATEAPILTGTSVEGTTTLFAVDYFGNQAYLTQSGQLYLEATAMALGRVYWIGPVFRAEKSKTRKHVTEFWMAEGEMAYYDHEDNLRLQEDLIAYVVRSVVSERKRELDLLERDTERLLEESSPPYPRIDYTEAIDLLQKAGHQVDMGVDLGAPHEASIGDHFGKPVFIERFLASMKPFYMKRDPNDRTRVLAADLIAPEGYGELIGGSQRVDTLEELTDQLAERNLPSAPYEWYLDLRRYGAVPHSGFGLGVARTIAWICGVPHIREVIPFARQINRLYP